jgi:hypothetical protein
MKPSLDSVSKSAEIVGAFAVVLSLMYVGYQVQQNTKAIQSTVHQSLVSHVFEAEGMLLSSSDLAQIILKSNSNAESLTPAERLRSDTYFTFAFVNWESAYLNYQQGLLEEWLWESWDRSNYPDDDSRGYFDFWLENRDWYDDAFAHHVDKIYRDRGYTATKANNSQIVENE